MLAPEKSANLIFIGNYDTSSFNYTFYKLDDIKIKENLIIRKFNYIKYIFK